MKKKFKKEIQDLRRQITKLEKSKSKLKLAQQQGKQHSEMISFLAKTATKFAEFPVNKDIYRFIGECLKKIIPDAMIFINSFDQTTGIIRTQVALGIGAVSKKTLKLLGRHPVGMTFKISKEALLGLTTNRLNKVPGGLYVLSFGEIPKSICHALEKIYHIKHIYAIGFTWRGKLYGNATFIMREEKEAENQKIIEAFIKQASIALQRRQAEKQIKESEEKFRTLFESANDVIVLVNKQGKVLDVNEKVTDLTGYRTEEIKGKYIFRLGVLVREDLPTIVKLFKDAVSTGKLKTGKGKDTNVMEMEFRHKKGTKIYVEINTRRIYKKGKLQGFLSIIRDITERKRAEQKLHYQVDLLQNVSDAIISTDLDFNIRTWNKAAETMYGWEAYEVIDKPLHKITKSNYLSESFNTVLKQIIKKGCWHGNIEQKRKNDTALHAFSSARIMKDVSGNPVCIVTINHDVTENVRATELITSSLKQKEVLLKEIHHRVKNNLQIIASLLSLQSRYVDEDRYFCFFKESQDRVKSMALIHQELYRSADLAHVNTTDYMSSLLKHLFSSYNIQPETIILKTNIQKVPMDIDLAIPCGLILNELVSNCLRHAFPHLAKTSSNKISSVGTTKNKKVLYSKTAIAKPMIKIVFRKEKKGMLTLIVSDNGIGFPETLNFRKTKTLGLQLICTLVDQVNGTIRLNRKKGTTFTISCKKTN